VSKTDLTTAHLTKETTLRPAINVWTIYLKDQGNSPHTIKAFTADMRLAASYLPPDSRLADITIRDLNQFIDWLQKGRGIPCSPKSLARRITSLKAFFRWLHEHGIILIDPAEQVIQRSAISPLPTVLTPDEVQTVLEIAQKYRQAEKPDIRYLTLVSLLLHTGIKKNECLALRPNHIDFDPPQGAILYIRYTNPQYRYKERKITLLHEWIEVYQEYINQYHIHDQVFPWSQRRLEYLLEDLSKEAGFEKHLSFDMCRWTCALTDWRSGMEHEKIRQKLGISKIQWREIRLKLDHLASQSTPMN